MYLSGIQLVTDVDLPVHDQGLFKICEKDNLHDALMIRVLPVVIESEGGQQVPACLGDAAMLIGSEVGCRSA
jgi:hypothetical protein